MEDKNNIQFITCPTCNGTGKSKAGLNCSACGGLGLGSFLNNKFLYWGLKLGRAVIKLRHLKRSVNFFINLAAYIFALIGLLALGWWIWSSQSGQIFDFTSGDNYLELFSFWRVKHWLILIFWISVLADMFIIYRLSKEEASKQKIPVQKWKRESKEIKKILPNNWEELKKYKNKVDVSQTFNREVLKVIENAFLLAEKSKQTQFSVTHLFFSLLRDREVVAFFVRLNVGGKKLIDKIKNQLLNEQIQADNLSKQLELSKELKEILIEAYTAAYNSGQDKVKVLNLILPCVKKDKNLAEILYDLEVNQDKINNVVEWFRANEKLIANYRIYKKMARFKPGTGMDRAYTAVATPILNHFSHDLTMAAKWGRLDLCVARDKEIEAIFQTLASSQPGVILTGLVGIGKRTIVEGIAQLMVKEEVPKFLRDKRLVELNIARLISGVTPSQAGERLLVVIDEIRRAGNIILYIENIENLIGITAGGEESLELSEVLADALSRKNLYCLSMATNKNYTRYIEGQSLGNVMARIDIKEPVGNQAIQIIESKISILEGKYKIFFSYNAIEQAVNLSSKFIHDKYLPTKAIKVLERTAVKIAKKCIIDKTKCLCTKDDIAETISAITHIPTQKITTKESKELLNLEEKIHERMINQDEAVNAVAASLRRARAELREGKRPISSFLFLGPTGVGKTELAKTVADIYFGDKSYMIRFDMSEYQHPDSVKKMIGDAAGTLGYLTEAVRKRPFSLILLDEFEKAYRDILNLFLQVMDDGRLTDGQGRTIDFTNSIIIATSNAGSIFIQEQVIAGTNIEKIKQELINEHLNKVMRPELINRFDGVIVFKPLSMDNVVEITKLMLKKIEKRLGVKGIGMRASQEGIIKLAKAGYDPKFGARPLRRLLQNKVENEIANKILAGQLKRRDIVIINREAQIEIEKGREL